MKRRNMIAKKRGLDPELLSMAAMLHDLHAYISGSYEDHAYRSYATHKRQNKNHLIRRKYGINPKIYT